MSIYFLRPISCHRTVENLPFQRLVNRLTAVAQALPWRAAVMLPHRFAFLNFSARPVRGDRDKRVFVVTVPASLPLPVLVPAPSADVPAKSDGRATLADERGGGAQE